MRQFQRSLALRLGVLILLLVSFVFASPAYSHGLRGTASIQARLYPYEPQFTGQNQHKFSLDAKPEYFHELDNGDLFTFIPFMRLDFADSDRERNHFDIRDLSYIYVQDSWELRFGVRQEFWGVAETTNLVNIINQIDAVEGEGETERLGQPMVNFSITKEWGILDLYILPYFRELTLTGRKGRGRPGATSEPDRAVFESSAENWHTDFAVRYFNSFEKLDVAVSHFKGTDRNPIAIFTEREEETFLKAFYQQTDQTGLELTYITGNWLLKFEGIRKVEQNDKDYTAWVGGFEYTFSGIGGTGMDLGVIGEWLYDDRGKEAAIYDNDVTYGLRLGFNDVNNSSILFFITQGVNTTSWFPVVKISTLLNDHWQFNLQYVGTMNQPNDAPFLYLSKDDYLQAEMVYNF